MSLSRQEEILASGRSNQKRRTRQALIDAATALAREGGTLTIADVAEAAQVSVATAYRYFSNPQELLLEIQTTVRAAEIVAELPDDPADRLDSIVARVMDLQLGDESLWRALLRATQDRWLSQDGQEPPVPIRGQNRLEMTRTALEPLQDTLPPQLHRRLTMAITLVYGMEAMVAARDACGLDPAESKDVMRWAVQALLQAARQEAAGQFDLDHG